MHLHYTVEHKFFLNSLHMDHRDSTDSHFFLFPGIDILSTTTQPCTISTSSNMKTDSSPPVNPIANNPENRRCKQPEKPKNKNNEPYIQHTPFSADWIVE